MNSSSWRMAISSSRGLLAISSVMRPASVPVPFSMSLQSMGEPMLDFIRFGIEWLPRILEGVPVTLALWAIAISLGCVLGLILCWARVYGNRFCYWISTIYVELFRGTPMLVQMFFIYLGLPHVGIVFDAFTAAV